jgi:hypothetical protein
VEIRNDDNCIGRPHLSQYGKDCIYAGAALYILAQPEPRLESMLPIVRVAGRRRLLRGTRRLCWDGGWPPSLKLAPVRTCPTNSLPGKVRCKRQYHCDQLKTAADSPRAWPLPLADVAPSTAPQTAAPSQDRSPRNDCWRRQRSARRALQSCCRPPPTRRVRRSGQ